MNDINGALPVALTMGEPAGIGGEIALQAWAELSPDGPAFFVIDDPIRLRALATDMGLHTPVAAIARSSEALRVFRHALPVLDVGSAVEAEPGRPSVRTAAAVIESISRAVSLVRSNERLGGLHQSNPEVHFDRGWFRFPRTYRVSR